MNIRLKDCIIQLIKVNGIFLQIRFHLSISSLYKISSNSSLFIYGTFTFVNDLGLKNIVLRKLKITKKTPAIITLKKCYIVINTLNRSILASLDVSALISFGVVVVGAGS